jgi:hypothetical protein
MVSRKQRAIYLATGGAAAATIVWLRFAKSAAGARTFLGRTGTEAGKTLGNIQVRLSTLGNRAEEIGRLVHEIAHLGSDQMAKAEIIFSDTLKRLEQTADVIQENLTLSSSEISALLKDIRITILHRSLVNRGVRLLSQPDPESRNI